MSGNDSVARAQSLSPPAGHGDLFAVGDRVILDSIVHGAIEGFYGASVVFRPDWTPGLAIWGTLERGSLKTYEGEPLSDGTKHVALSSLLVHPSNLRPEDADV